METKYTRQIVDKKIGYFDIEIFDEDMTKALLADSIQCETMEEAEFRANIIFDEIKKGNSFTVVESDGTRTTFRIATQSDIRTEPLYRQAEDALFEEDMTEEEIAQQKALEYLIKEATEEELDAIFDAIEEQSSDEDSDE